MSQAYDPPDDLYEPSRSTDIPLLQRESSPGGTSLRTRVPGSYEPSLHEEQDEATNTNIRYGRIPQRVPRRYKTMKKVE